MKPRVFIGVPNLGVVETVLSRRLREWYKSSKYQITIAEATGYRPIELAINNLLKQFLESDCEWLFIINSDECLPRDALARLLAHDVDVVAPLGLRWNCVLGVLPCMGIREGGGDDELAQHFENPEGVKMVSGKPRYVQPRDGFGGLQRVDRIGSSGILVKRHVVEAIPLGTWRLEMSEDRCKLYSSEDFVWCDAIRAAGFEIWLDSDLILDHFRKVNLATVLRLLLEAREKGQRDTLRALRHLREAGATDAEAIEGVLEWLESMPHATS